MSRSAMPEPQPIGSGQGDYAKWTWCLGQGTSPARVRARNVVSA
jgi:hypothetical protein